MFGKTVELGVLFVFIEQNDVYTHVKLKFAYKANDIISLLAVKLEGNIVVITVCWSFCPNFLFLRLLFFMTKRIDLKLD